MFEGESLNRLGSTVGHCPKIANSPILQRLMGKIRELEVFGDDPISEIKEKKESSMSSDLTLSAPRRRGSPKSIPPRREVRRCL